MSKPLDLNYRKRGDIDKRGNFNYCQWIEDNLFCHRRLIVASFVPYCPRHYKLSLNNNKKLKWIRP